MMLHNLRWIGLEQRIPGPRSLVNRNRSARGQRMAVVGIILNTEEEEHYRHEQAHQGGF